MRGQSIKIQDDKIYTSYFNRATKVFPDKRLVSISITSAQSFNGGYARELNPSKELLWAYKNGEITDEEYEKWYRDTILSKLNPLEIYDKYKGKILCCWEETGMFCHRHLIIKWLTEHISKDTFGGEV